MYYGNRTSEKSNPTKNNIVQCFTLWLTNQNEFTDKSVNSDSEYLSTMCNVPLPLPTGR